ncbi:MAG TPA: DUF885 domain-containing protein [Gemmatimonadaceae bacterium]|jgi:uncharacterized protein (DUF885 family)|nr:DUF885 domain-containing protein [Gemmatimonadaceae bacterium]
MGTHRVRILTVITAIAASLVVLVASRSAPSASETFARFVDDYLDDFARRHPSIAAGNGIHGHDDLLDDFSAAAIAAEITKLEEERAFLSAKIDTTSLTLDERVDRRILLGIIDGWLLEQQTLANWRRNPMQYGSALADGIHDLMTKESAPAPVRMRYIIAKLRAAPKLIAAARANIQNPPRLFAERGAAMMRGAAEMLGKDLDLAFAAEPNARLRDSLRRAADAVIPIVNAYATYLERDVAPRATGDFTIGAVNLARRYRAEEMIDTPLDQLVAIGERELRAQQAAFRAAAERLAPGKDPVATWVSVRRIHPPMGGVVGATQAIVDSLTSFVSSRGIASVPRGERVVVAPALPFDLGFASMHASPPLEPKPVKSIFYITDARPDMPAQQREEWLERYNYASLSNTAAHEAMPGHWLHSTYMRKTPGKVRRIWIGLNSFPQPSSGQDGWAHYAEQLVLDEGYDHDDPRLRLAQLSDALTRICRLLSGIKVHTKSWTLADAQRCFEKEAYVAAPAAKREAERSAYDPTYGGYFLGKRAILKLRTDYAARLGSKFNLRDFHERFMTNGIAPIKAQRMLLLPGDTSSVID